MRWLGRCAEERERPNAEVPEDRVRPSVEHVPIKRHGHRGHLTTVLRPPTCRKVHLVRDQLTGKGQCSTETGLQLRDTVCDAFDAHCAAFPPRNAAGPSEDLRRANADREGWK